jgi:hypothetical protein
VDLRVRRLRRRQRRGYPVEHQLGDGYGHGRDRHDGRDRHGDRRHVADDERGHAGADRHLGDDSDDGGVEHEHDHGGGVEYDSRARDEHRHEHDGGSERVEHG